MADGAGGAPVAVPGRMGDAPAIVTDAGAEGLVMLIYQSTPSTLTYSEREKFDAFVTHKDLGVVAAAHTARGLPDTGIKEVYTRYSKALVAVGHGQGQDRALGLETELVALKNPYTDAMDQGMPVLLTYQGAPRADAQIEVFEKAPDGAVTVFTIRTDGAGHGVVPVTPGHVYMLDAVVLREPDAGLAAQTGAVWESLWANLVFAVPG